MFKNMQTSCNIENLKIQANFWGFSYVTALSTIHTSEMIPIIQLYYVHELLSHFLSSSLSE